eukprot:scaffold17914_cov74-Skeletonema_dohrnii-CCMP3373.AAC.1
MVSFQKTILAIKEFNSRLDQTPSLSLEKWRIHQVRAAELLGITGANNESATAILDEFCKCLKRGYAGVKSNAETYKPTKHKKIDVFNPEANQLNFHAYKRRTHAKTPYTGEMPSIDAASHDATYYRFGGGGETSTAVYVNTILILLNSAENCGTYGPLINQAVPCTRQNICQ